jgi:VanZ family protein
MQKKNKSLTRQQVNFILYVLLLIMTPFLLLQNYLQAAIGIASNSHFEYGDFSLPYVLIVVGFIALALFFYVRKQLRWKHLGFIPLILFLFWLGQQNTDYYFNHKFYELQHNWHYIAYSGFAVISWRFWKSQGKNAAQIILYSLILAFSVSVLDEVAQVPLSNRIFDVCDIAKDIYGVVLGNILVFYVLDNGVNMPSKLRITHPSIKEYFQNPLTLLLYEFLFVFIFLVFASVLSELRYIFFAFAVPAGIFIIIWLFIHLSQFKIGRIAVSAFLLLVILALSASFAINYDKDFSYNAHGITIYKGIPLPFLDVMIFENGSFRLVDKKHEFNKRDQRTILTKCTDILIIGSGSQGKGGIGFTEREPVQFIFNPNIGRMTQIIILKTPQACELYNRLKKENKNVTFILHNTC